MHCMVTYAIMLKTCSVGRCAYACNIFIDLKNNISYMLAIIPKCQRNTKRKTREEKILLPGKMCNL